MGSGEGVKFSYKYLQTFAVSVHLNIIHNLRYLSSNTMLCHLSLKVILYKNNMHMLLKHFATVLCIKIHHHQFHRDNCNVLSADLAEFIYLFDLFMKS